MLVERDIHPGNCPAISSAAALVKAVNYARARVRPREPRGLDWEFDPRYIPATFDVSRQVIVQHGDQPAAHHLLVASNSQLDFLSRAKTW
jgi:hypothetical protein